MQICDVPPFEAPNPRGTGGGHEWRNAVQSCRVGIRSILAMEQARSPMAMGGLGIMKLDAGRAAVAGMCAAAGSLARMLKWLRELRGWDVERNARMPMCGYQWITQRIEQVLQVPGSDEDGVNGGTLRAMIVAGWLQTERLREARKGLSRDENHEFGKLITRTIYTSRLLVYALR